MLKFPNCDYLLLDLDGVLIDTKGMHSRAFNAAMSHLGLPMFVGEEAITTNQKLDVLGIREQEVRTAVKRQKDVAFRSMFDEIRYLPILPIWIALAREHRFKAIGLCTNCSSDIAREILRHCGLQGSFHAVITQGDLKNPKPHPEIYLRGMAAIGAYPARTLVFEDSDSGMQAATDAGVIAIKTTFKEMMERFEKCEF